jgi:hypothetical protein
MVSGNTLSDANRMELKWLTVESNGGAELSETSKLNAKIIL